MLKGDNTSQELLYVVKILVVDHLASKASTLKGHNLIIVGNFAESSYKIVLILD